MKKKEKEKRKKLTYEEGLGLVKVIQKKIEVMNKNSSSAPAANERLLRY